MNKDSITEECKRIKSIYQKYSDQYTELNSKAEKNCVKWKYSIGSKLMHRGYYCPSLVEDIIVGNCSRGKLTDKLPAKKSYYSYGFDACGDLIVIVENTCAEKEFLLREQNYELGLVFDKNFCIQGISEFEFDESDKLLRYAYYTFTLDGKICNFTIEEYSYPENKLIMDRFEIVFVGECIDNYVYKHERYYFTFERKKPALYKTEDCEFITNDTYLSDFKSFIENSMKNFQTQEET